MSHPSYWTPTEIAYLYFYLSHGITHEGIAKLLAHSAPRVDSDKARKHDGVRAKAKALRRQFELNSPNGKPDVDKIRHQLRTHLYENNLDLALDRNLSQEEEDIVASVYHLKILFYYLLTHTYMYYSGSWGIRPNGVQEGLAQSLEKVKSSCTVQTIVLPDRKIINTISSLAEK